LNIEPVDNKLDLFQVSHLLPDDLLVELSKLPLETVPFTKQEWQEDWDRRLLVPTQGSVLESIAEYYDSKKSDIGKFTGLDITKIDTRFWFDYEGFTCNRHTDNEGVDYVMQIFLSEASTNLGTVFYEDDKVRKAFEFTKNSGYIMFNNKGQTHGMEQKVPKDMQRLTSYSYFQTR
jgi:hypothetical protein|tara:strand:- start:18 stop:545 length:528 start_codon:yes stop_codon:yes gene_type:complete